ncbi:MAG TPA: 3'-5' exonuclease, partial [Nitrospirota bacterium]|nr:3'-5' exonuclease [Nitrospirota bacterium]
QDGVRVFERTSDQQNAGWRLRAVRYADCAVLIQSRTRLKEYEAALRQEGIPFRVVGGIGFYEEDEIQALLNTLFFLWNNDDLLALAGALKSPLFNLTDADLFAITHSGDPVWETLEQRHPAPAALLSAWTGLAGLVPLAALLHRIIDDTGAYVRFGRHNPQALFNIDKLLDTAREFDRRGYTMLQDFVEWIGNIRATEQREATADMTLPGFEGAVSILTVHKAKGLEYPVVFLPGMHQQPKSVLTGPPVLVESDGGVRMAKKGGSNPLYDELWKREKAELCREHQRLLYVAMTRARDHLIMIGSLEEGSSPARQNTWLEYLHRTAPKPLFNEPSEVRPGLRRYACPQPETGRSRADTDLQQGDASPGGAAPAPRSIDLDEVRQHLAPVPRSNRGDWRRATDFIEHELPFPPPMPPSAEADVPPLVRGSVLHRCLEDLTRQGNFNLNRIAAGYPEVARLSGKARDGFLADMQTALRTILGNERFAWIFERREDSYSELPFLYKKGDDFVSGVIDRLVIKNGTGHVVDYKAILIENEAAGAAWVEHYKPQLRIYCEAALELFGLGSAEGSVLFLDSAKLVRAVNVRKPVRRGHY